jgi:hypothetical protein
MHRGWLAVYSGVGGGVGVGGEGGVEEEGVRGAGRAGVVEQGEGGGSRFGGVGGGGLGAGRALVDAAFSCEDMLMNFAVASAGAGPPGTHFTRVTSTRVQILRAEALLWRGRARARQALG